MLFYQPKDGYCYNSDSIFLYDFISSFKPKGLLLDVGAGCGIVGLLVADEHKKVELEAIEKQDVFITLATTNARVNNIEYNLHKGDFLEYDFLKKYDYIVSNPPFYPEGVTKSKNEMIFGARYGINLPLDMFFKRVSRLLKPNSHFIFCYEASSFSKVIYELEKVKLRAIDVRFVYPKKDRVASLVMVHARNGSKSSTKIHPPLIHFDGKEFSDEVKQIYKKASTQSIKCQI